MAKGSYKTQLRKEIVDLGALYEKLPDNRPFDEVKNRIDMLIWKRTHKLYLFSAIRCSDVSR